MNLILKLETSIVDEEMWLAYNLWLGKMRFMSVDTMANSFSFCSKSQTTIKNHLHSCTKGGSALTWFSQLLLKLNHGLTWCLVQCHDLIFNLFLKKKTNTWFTQCSLSFPPPPFQFKNLYLISGVKYALFPYFLSWKVFFGVGIEGRKLGSSHWFPQVLNYMD